MRPKKKGERTRRLLPWAEAWQQRLGQWPHRIYLISKQDPRLAVWIEENLRLPEIAEWWKSYKSTLDSAYTDG